MEAIVYSKAFVIKSNVAFPCVSNNFRGTQLTWQYRHRRLGFICYHSNQSRADEQLKLVAFKQTPATQIVEPKPKPKLKLSLVEKLLIGGMAVSTLGFVLLDFVILPKKLVLVGSLSASSMPWEVICSKLEHECERRLLFSLLSLFSCLGLVLIQLLYTEVDESEYEKRLALKILGVIFMLGFVPCSAEYMSVAYRIDILSRLVFRDWHWPYHLIVAIVTVSFYICSIGFLAAHEYYQKVDENNDSEKGLDLKLFGVILMVVDVACSPEFMSIAYAMDTLSRSVFRDWHLPYNLNVAVFFISLHICCRGLRAVVDLHHEHSELRGCEKNYFNKRSWKQTRSLCKNSSRRRMNRQK